MSTPTPNYPGMIYPVSKGMLAGNPRDSAIAAQKAIDIKQTSLNNAVGGKRRKNGGGTVVDPNTWVVPQFNMLYSPAGANGQDPNNITKFNSQISTQGLENAKYDKYASMKGGKKGKIGKKTSKRKRKGGSVKWGCYSGGKRNRKTIRRNK
jgi:hypothetical protein